MNKKIKIIFKTSSRSSQHTVFNNEEEKITEKDEEISPGHNGTNSNENNSNNERTINLSILDIVSNGDMDPPLTSSYVVSNSNMQNSINLHNVHSMHSMHSMHSTNSSSLDSISIDDNILNLSGIDMSNSLQDLGNLMSNLDRDIVLDRFRHIYNKIDDLSEDNCNCVCMNMVQNKIINKLAMNSIFEDLLKSHIITLKTKLKITTDRKMKYPCLLCENTGNIPRETKNHHKLHAVCFECLVSSGKNVCM